MPESPEKFYVTTPIYYVNARPHIGHAYTTIVADVLARRHRLLGHDTFFLTGTDEHGQKIERSARAAGIEPQRFADQVSQTFRDLWIRMGILDDTLSHNDPLLHRDFIRTTEPRHIQGVQHLFRQLQQRGAIYKSTYTGQYCVSDEAYVDGPPGIRCPDCGRLTETVAEENYYFKLSQYQRPLLDLIESNTLRITPDSRRNEVLSFLRGNVASAAPPHTAGATSMAQSDMGGIPDRSPAAQSPDITAQTPGAPLMAQSDMGGIPDRSPTSSSPDITAQTAAGTPYVPGALKDLSISRTSFTWGVPVPDDPAHVIYVWLDALANYMTAVGYGSDTPADQALFQKFWPADLHLVGKEIIRFHCVYWPAFLLALNPATASGAPRLDPETWVSTPPELSPDLSPQPERSAVERPAVVPATTPFEVHRLWAAKMLPKAVAAHGWLLFEESKMSKSRGNIVRTETILDAFGTHYRSELVRLGQPEPSPHDADLFATDVLRYFLLREIPFGQDGSFSFDALITRYNADLANGYGNLVSRTLSLIAKTSSGVVEDCLEANSLVFYQPELKQTHNHPEQPEILSASECQLLAWSLREVIDRVADNLQANSFADATATIASAIASVDRLMTSRKPWAATDTELSQQGRRSTLYTAAESIRILTALLYPILPYSTARVWAQLGLGNIEDAARRGDLNHLQWGGLQPGTRLGPLAPIFPRAEKGLAQIMTDMESTKPPASSDPETPGPPSTPGTPSIAQSDLGGRPQTPGAPSMAQSDLGGRPQTPGAPSMAQSDMGGRPQPPAPPSPQATPTPETTRPAPSRFSNETTSGAHIDPADSTHPGAPPRVAALPHHDPIAQVGASSAPVPDLPRTPSHTQARPSGLFSGAASPIPQPAPLPGEAPDPAPFALFAPQITIDDFAKVDLRAARILVAERIPKADKLLRLEVDLGSERRQILSGIAEWYTPEELVGRRIVVIANLAPRTMRGLVSHGMLLAASHGEAGKPILATFPESDDLPPGARLK